MESTNFNEIISEIVRKDARYDREAYVFLRDGLEYTIKKYRKARKDETEDIPTPELLEGLRFFALKEYGPMASTVLNYWGIHSCEDFGHIVFNLVDAKIFSKTENDTIEAFRAGYNFDDAFESPFRPTGKILSENEPAGVKGSSC